MTLCFEVAQFEVSVYRHVTGIQCFILSLALQVRRTTLGCCLQVAEARRKEMLDGQENQLPLSSTDFQPSSDTMSNTGWHADVESASSAESRSGVGSISNAAAGPEAVPTSVGASNSLADNVSRAHLTAIDVGKLQAADLLYPEFEVTLPHRKLRQVELYRRMVWELKTT